MNQNLPIIDFEALLPEPGQETATVTLPKALIDKCKRDGVDPETLLQRFAEDLAGKANPQTDSESLLRRSWACAYYERFYNPTHTAISTTDTGL